MKLQKEELRMFQEVDLDLTDEGSQRWLGMLILIAVTLAWSGVIMLLACCLCR